MKVLEVLNLNKSFGKTQVLKDISLSLKSGEILSILGGSGCGKSTLLRIIAGLEKQDSGEIKALSSISLMFQNYALMPHLNVSENIALALYAMPAKERQARVDELLERFFIADLAKARIDEISGGQAQRVAFARAVANRAGILLLDEPFANLDTALKSAMRNELKSLIKSSGLAAILVTHDKDDVFVMSDSLALIKQGSLLDYASVRELYERPKNAEVASFLGAVNDLTALKCGGLKECGAGHSDEFMLELEKRRFIFRPEEIVAGFKFKAKVVRAQYFGAYYELLLDFNGALFLANIYTKFDGKDEFFFDFI